MPLTSVQKGAVGQFTFFAIAIATGKGEVEVYTPAADNEGRDAEVRRHARRTPGIGVQVKVAFMTVKITRTNKQDYLEIRFTLPKDRIQNDPRFWYFLALFDRRQLKFHDPVFLVPSRIFHKMARNGSWRGRANFEMAASLGPASRDRWAPYRVSLRDLGNRLLEIVDEMGLTASRDLIKVPFDSLWVSRAARGGAASLRTDRPDRKYDLIRKAVIERNSLSAWYKGHLRVISPFLLGTKAGDPHVLGYQFDGTSKEPLGPEGSSENWRCLRVAELTKIKVLPGIWHPVPKGSKAHQHCIEQVDVSAYRPSPVNSPIRHAA
jgi:hypothetical protein